VTGSVPQMTLVCKGWRKLEPEQDKEADRQTDATECITTSHSRVAVIHNRPLAVTVGCRLLDVTVMLADTVMLARLINALFCTRRGQQKHLIG